MEKNSIDKESEESLDQLEENNNQNDNTNIDFTYTNITDPEKVIQLSLNRGKSKNLFQWREKLDKVKYKSNEQYKKFTKDQINKEIKQFDFSDLIYKYENPQNINLFFNKIVKQKLKTTLMQAQFRKQIWLLTSHVSYLQQQVYPNYYKSLFDYKDYPDYYFDSIQKDLVRTYSDSEAFKENYNKMNYILTMYARRNPYVGYCQGMNFLAFQISTMNFTVEESFWFLVQLIETILPIDYYTTMMGVICDIKIFQHLLKYHNPTIYKKFQEIQLDVSLFLVQWFVCIYSNVFSQNLSLIVWDHLFAEGQIVLFKVGLVLLDYCEKELKEVKEFPQAIFIVDDVTKKITSEQEFNDKISKIYISKKAIKYAQDLLRNQCKCEKSKQKAKKVKKKIKKDQTVNCNIKWPICHKILQSEVISKNDKPFFVFRQAKHIEIVKDYFSRSDKIIQHYHDMSSNRRENLLCSNIKPQNLEKLKQDFYQELVIGRIDHNCNKKAYEESLKKKPQEFLEMKQYNQIEIQYDQDQILEKDGTTKTNNKKQFTSFAQQQKVFETQSRKNSNISLQQQLECNIKGENDDDESKQSIQKQNILNLNVIKQRCHRSQTLQILKKSQILKSSNEEQNNDEQIYNKYQKELENTKIIKFFNNMQQSKVQQLNSYLSGQNNFIEDDQDSDNDDYNLVEQQ